jgi:cobalt-zinc-cadmium resistance protein CzcA
MRPRLILITVAMLGMIPAAIATGIGSDVQRPLATVVVGGLLSTLFLTLLALPSLYYLVESWRLNRYSESNNDAPITPDQIDEGARPRKETRE